MMPEACSAQSSLRKDAPTIVIEGLVHGVSHFFQLILPSLFPWLRSEFDLSYAELGFLMTIMFIVSAVGQTLSGFVVDRVGARVVLYFGVACLGLSALLLSIAPSYGVLLLATMVAGIGNCVFHPACFSLLNHNVSPAHLGHAFSVHGISGNLGWAAAPAIIAPLAGLYGWRSALAAAAGLAVAMLVLLFTYRDVLDGAPRKIAINVNEKGNEARSNAFGFLRLPAVWMCFAFFLLTSTALGGVQSFSPTALSMLYDLSFATATTGYTAYMLASAVGMVWGGFLAARTTRHERTIAVGFTAAGIFSIVIATSTIPPVMVVTMMGLVGLGAGIAGPSRDLLIRAAAPPNATGRVYGVVYSGLDIGLSLAPLIFGIIMDGGHPSWLFIGIGVLQAMALLTAVKVGKGCEDKRNKKSLVS